MIFNKAASVRAYLALVISVLVWTGCSSGVPEISIEEQEAKLSPIIVGSGSVFMKIRNSGKGDDTLLRAKASIVDTIVELHEVLEGKMARTDRIPIPANSIVQLRPASYHIMIFRMPKSVQEGQQFILTLSFDKSGDISVPLQLITNATNRRKDRYH